jgi:enoyl-[acyl-carrier-protein] reductase (NADH)
MKIKQVLKRVWRYLLKGMLNIDVRVDVAMIDRGQCLKDKKILITGGSKGLGFAIAKRCITEVAEVAVFLLSDASKCISGEIINCDAGNYISSYF